jgi:chemotaxis protein MotB
MAFEEEPPPEGAPEWMVTYSDMISLLVTFFILLMTFSSPMDDNKFPMAGAMFGPGGMMGSNNTSDVDPPPDDMMSAMDIRRGATVPHTRPADKLSESKEDMGQKSADRTEFNLRDVKDGLVLHFDEGCSFKPGSARVNVALHAKLGELGRVLENYAFLIIIEGFTDTAFNPSPTFPTAQAMASARAYAAARSMLEQSNVSDKMIQIAGLGPEKPLNDNVSASDRRLNRRIEIRIVSLSRDRARALDAAAKNEGR